MVVVGDAATHNEKEVKTRYPVAEGLEAGTEKQTGFKFLNTNVKSLVASKDKVGLS